MRDVYDRRCENLRNLVDTTEGGMNGLGRLLGLKKGAYISQLLSPPGTRSRRMFSEKTARKWEQKLAKADGWFDKDHRPQPKLGEQAPVQLNTQVLTKVITAVLEAFNAAEIDLPASDKFADILVMQYVDALASGQIDAKRLAKLVNLLKH